jgi:hypothetical protein
MNAHDSRGLEIMMKMRLSAVMKTGIGHGSWSAVMMKMRHRQKETPQDPA